MTPTQLADYVAENLPPTSTPAAILEFTGRLSELINEYPEAVKVMIFEAIENEFNSIPCKAHPA